VIKKFIALGIFIIIVVGGSLAAYFILRDNSAQGPDIGLGQKFYIQRLYNGFYQYPASAGTHIKLESEDLSYCIFPTEGNFKTFQIVFVRGGVEVVTFDFIVTNLKRGNGKLRANVTQIYAGDFRSFRIRTTRTNIIMEAALSYRVLVGRETYDTAEEYENQPLTLIRRNTPVMYFLRKPPKWTPEGKYG